MAMTRQQFSFGAAVAVLAAVVAVLSSMLTLYNQASDVLTRVVAGNFAPVGTIVASTFDEVAFARLVNEDPGGLTPSRKWILADGRDAQGTKFAFGRTETHVPDLRGMFLRGIDPSGKLDPEGARSAGSIQKYGTARPVSPFAGTSSDNGTFALPNNTGYSTVGDLGETIALLLPDTENKMHSFSGFWTGYGT